MDAEHGSFLTRFQGRTAAGVYGVLRRWGSGACRARRAIAEKAMAGLSAAPWLPVLRWARSLVFRSEVLIGAGVLALLTVVAILVGPAEKRARQEAPETATAGAASGDAVQDGEKTAPESTTAQGDAPAAGGENRGGGGTQAQTEQETGQPEPKVSAALASSGETSSPDNRNSMLILGSEMHSSYWLAEGRKQVAAHKTAEAQASFTKSLKLARVEHDRRAVAAASAELGYLYQETNALHDASNAFQQSLSIYEELSETDGVSRVSCALAMIRRLYGRHAEAEGLYLKAIKLDEAQSKQEELARDYNGLGLTHLATGKYDMAEEDHLKALEINKKLRSDHGVAEGYANLGQVYYKRGDLDRSADMFKKAIAMEGAADLKQGAGTNYSNLGAVFKKKGDLPAACAYWKKAREIMRKEKAKAQLHRVEATMESESCGRNGEGPGVVRELFSFLGDLAGDSPSSGEAR